MPGRTARARSRAEGTIIHNDNSNLVQFCNGTNWVAMGPVPGAGGAGCGSPARPEGKMVYNRDHCVLQYCDGANWIGAGGRSNGCSGPADPANLEIKGSVQNSQLNGAEGVAVSGNYAYVAAGSSDRLTVVDVSNPAAPAVAGSVQSAQLDGARASRCPAATPMWRRGSATV